MHAIGFYSPRSRFWAKNSSLLTIWKACKNMTQPANANTAPHSSWETDVLVPSASQSSTSSSPSPAGVKSCWTDSQLLTGRRWDRVVLFQLWLYNSVFQTLSFTAMSCLNGWTLLSHAPERSSRNYWKNNHMTRRKQSLNSVSCIAVGYTCHSADKCISLNRCFHLKSLHLAPNFCQRYTMGYLNILLHTQNYKHTSNWKIP